MADWLRGVECLGPARIEGRLLDLGPYPGALPGEGEGFVVGELLRITEPGLLARLDRYEGFDPGRPEASLFVRREVVARLPDGEQLPCIVYAYARDPGNAPEVPGGDWNLRGACRPGPPRPR